MEGFATIPFEQKQGERKVLTVSSSPHFFFLPIEASGHEVKIFGILIVCIFLNIFDRPNSKICLLVCIFMSPICFLTLK